MNLREEMGTPMQAFNALPMLSRTMVLKRTVHWEQEMLLLRFSYEEELIQLGKSADALFSKTAKKYTHVNSIKWSEIRSPIDDLAI